MSDAMGELKDDMSLTEALNYVLAQYEAPDWMVKHIGIVADMWESKKDGPNYGKPDHPEGYDGWCVCDECLRSA